MKNERQSVLNSAFFILHSALGLAARLESPTPAELLPWDSTQHRVDEEAIVMRMRLGAPLLAAMVGLLGAVQYAAAAHCGCSNYSCCPQPCCDAQCCFPTCQQQCKTCYKLVYDTVLEKRWQTCYQTVQETVMKQVCKTCYRQECKTCYRSCYANVLQTSALHHLQAVLQDVLQGSVPDLLQAVL